MSYQQEKFQTDPEEMVIQQKTVTPSNSNSRASMEMVLDLP